MTAPHTDSEHKVATEPTSTPTPAAQQSPPEIEYAIPQSPVDNNPTAAERLASWWNTTLPRGARTALTQFLMALVVVLLVLPLSSALGWFGLHNVSPTSAKTTNQTTNNSASPNAPTHQLYDPAMPPTLQGSVVNVHLVAKEVTLSIAPGIAYKAWTFNGTVPGPVVHVRQGQTVKFTLTNDDPKMAHSIDFHAAQTAWSVNYQPVAPGKSLTFSFKADYPGAFLYHCGTPPVMEHISNGMYGAIIVDPAKGWATKAQEFVLVQSEFFTQRDSDGTYSLDTTKMSQNKPDYVVFNGFANQYTQTPITVKAGQPIRLYVVNAGPTHFSAFHVIGAIFSSSYADGNPANRLLGNQTITVPPGGGSVVELTIPNAGTYPVVTHSFLDATLGALGMIKATA